MFDAILGCTDQLFNSLPSCFLASSPLSCLTACIQASLPLYLHSDRVQLAMHLVTSLSTHSRTHQLCSRHTNHSLTLGSRFISTSSPLATKCSNKKIIMMLYPVQKINLRMSCELLTLALTTVGPLKGHHQHCVCP